MHIDYRRWTRTPIADPYPRVVGVHEVADRWVRIFTSDVVVAALMTVTTVLGAIGESHPRQPIDKVSHGHVTPVAPWPKQSSGKASSQMDRPFRNGSTVPHAFVTE